MQVATLLLKFGAEIVAAVSDDQGTKQEGGFAIDFVVGGVAKLTVSIESPLPENLYEKIPCTGNDLFIGDQKGVFQRPLPHQFGTSVGLDHQVRRQAFWERRQDGRDRLSTHPAEADPIDFACGQNRKAIAESNIGRVVRQCAARVLQRSGFVLDRDSKLDAAGRQQGADQMAMIGADVGMPRPADLPGNGAKARVKSRHGGKGNRFRPKKEFDRRNGLRLLRRTPSSLSVGGVIRLPARTLSRSCSFA